MDPIIQPDSAPEPTPPAPNISRPDTAPQTSSSTTGHQDQDAGPEKEPALAQEEQGHLKREANHNSEPPLGSEDLNSEPAETIPDAEDPLAESGVDPESAAAGPSNPEPFTETPEPGSLEEFVLRAQKERLPADDEARASAVLSELLLGGRNDVARAVSCIPKLPWTIVTQAASKAWPEMKASFRTQMLAGLTKSEGEAAARIRLSLARGLFKIDQAAALKLIILTLKSMRDRASGLLSGKGASHFAGVLIGRGKAWILQVPTESLKPAEIDLLVQSALHGAFHAPQPPLTQIHTLKWAGNLNRLQKLTESLEELILKSITRWSSKWQGVLRREIKDLPEAWLASLKQTHSSSQGSAGEDTSLPTEGQQASTEDEAVPSKPRNPRHAARSENAGNIQTRSASEREPEGEDEDPTDVSDSDELEAIGPDSEAPGHSQKRERPVYVSKTIPSNSNEAANESGPRSETQSPHSQRRGSPANTFNLHETLRQIESYANGLRAELAASQKQLRNAEENQKRTRRTEKTAPAPIPGFPSVDELNRLNQQLEFRNAELKARIDEMTLDSEERATSRGLAAAEPQEPDACEQLKTLLAFKLQEDFEDFHALQQQSKDIVVQQHYKTVIQHVFEVLQAEGIPLTIPR